MNTIYVDAFTVLYTFFISRFNVSFDTIVLLLLTITSKLHTEPYFETISPRMDIFWNYCYLKAVNLQLNCTLSVILIWPDFKYPHWDFHSTKAPLVLNRVLKAQKDD